MTTTNKQIKIISKSSNDALIDQLRACQTSSEILKFEKWFNSNIESEKLYESICKLLKNRSISRGLASKWLLTLIEDIVPSIPKIIIITCSSISVKPPLSFLVGGKCVLFFVIHCFLFLFSGYPSLGTLPGRADKFSKSPLGDSRTLKRGLGPWVVWWPVEIIVRAHATFQP